MSIPLSNISGRMIAEFRVQRNPPPEVRNVFITLLAVISPELKDADRTWEEALSAMADSKKFIKKLTHFDPKTVSKEVQNRIKPFCDNPNPTTNNQVADGIVKWLVSVYKACSNCTDPEATQEAEKSSEERQQVQVAVATPKKHRDAASVTSGCVVLGSCSELPVIKVSDTHLTVLRRNDSLLWSEWVPQPSLPKFSFDTCQWGVQNRFFNKKPSTNQEIYNATLSDLVKTSLAGHPVFLCIAGSQSIPYLTGTDCGPTSILEQCFREIGEISPKSVIKVQVGRVGELDGEEAKFVDVSPAELIVRGGSVLKDGNIIIITCDDIGKSIYISLCNGCDSALSSVHTWAVSASEGASRLVSHQVQSIAADAFGPHGFVRLIAAVDAGGQTGDVKSLSYMQLVRVQQEKQHTKQPAVVTPAAALQLAREQLESVRKSDLSQLRTTTPSGPVRAATEAALLCCGIGVGGVSPVHCNWDSVRRSLCDPGVLQALKKKDSLTTLPDPAWKRLQHLIRKCQTLPWSADDNPQIINVGITLAKWSTAILSFGLVRKKPSPRTGSVGRRGASSSTRRQSSLQNVDSTARDLTISYSQSLDTTPPTAIAESEENGTSPLLTASDELKQLTTLSELTSTMKSLERQLHAKDTLLHDLQQQLARTKSQKVPSDKPRVKVKKSFRPSNDHLTPIQKSWRVLVRCARRELTELELLHVTPETLRKLISLYRISNTDGKHIIKYWEDAQQVADKSPSKTDSPLKAAPINETDMHTPCHLPTAGDTSPISL